MIRRRTVPAVAVLLLLLAAGPSTAPSTTAPSADAIKAALQGSWTATATSGGPGGSRPADLSLTVDGDHMTLTDRGREERAVITIDPAHTPTWFELKSDAGQQYVSGVLDVTADQMRMAFRKQGEGDRPAGFDPAHGVSVLTFHRGAATTRPATTRP